MEYGNYGRRALGPESRGGQRQSGVGIGDTATYNGSPGPFGPGSGPPSGGYMGIGGGPPSGGNPSGIELGFPSTAAPTPVGVAPHGNMYRNPKQLGGYRGPSGAPPGSPNTYSAAANMANAGANEPIGNPGGNPSGGYPGITPNPGFYGQPPRPQGVPLDYVFTPGPSGGRPQDYWVPAPGMSPGSGNY